MVAESRAYFRELIEHNLDATYLVRSDFAMLNEKLAKHYGILGVSGSQIRRVPLSPDCPRGGFLTQAAVLKVTANGTTTSPVPRGAFVMARLLGQPPEPPPPNIPAVEPDVRGAATIREQLDKHRSNATCAACHAKIDPPGFALESFDVIGGLRTRYRSIGEGRQCAAWFASIRSSASRSSSRKPVDPSGTLADQEQIQRRARAPGAAGRASRDACCAISPSNSPSTPPGVISAFSDRVRCHQCHRRPHAGTAGWRHPHPGSHELTVESPLFQLQHEDRSRPLVTLPGRGQLDLGSG